MKRIIEKIAKRDTRKKRVRKKIYGTSERPRLSVFRSNANFYAQLIDDDKGHTLLSISTLEKTLSGFGGNKEAAKKAGELLGKRALHKDIKELVFDRNGYLYHGRIKAFADGVRSAGLKF